MDIDRDTTAIYVVEAAESPELMLSGTAVGLWGAGEGRPRFTRLARTPGGARFIGPTGAQIPAIIAKFPLLKAIEVVPGSYPDDDRAARFVDAMDAAAGELAAVLPQAAFSTVANTVASAPSREWRHRVVASHA